MSRGRQVLGKPRSPQTEGNKGKGKEVEEALTPKFGGFAAANTHDTADQSDWADDDDGFAATTVRQEAWHA